jgi:hypothetical protein
VREHANKRPPIWRIDLNKRAFTFNTGIKAVRQIECLDGRIGVSKMNGKYNFYDYPALAKGMGF